MANPEDLSIQYDNLFAGTFPVEPGRETIASGEGVLPRGRVLGRITASGKLASADSADSAAGNHIGVAVLGEAVDATAADVKATVYYTGTFNEDALSFGGSDDKEDHRYALQARNIYLKTIA